MDFKVQKSNIRLGGKRYMENETYDFDEKKKEVKELVKNGFLVKDEKPASKDTNDNKSKDAK